ncbi:MAG: GIY-YIG nuclease [Oleiphilus sp.]|nr:MAG: GIY-YIG nuclease [Oleiphilus sp.]
MQASVYIMASGRNGTLYIGVTSDLVKRVWQHKQGFVEGFTYKYAVKSLVYYEQHISMESAILREKQMKKWRRQWKVNLIQENNPHWEDLWGSIIEN